MTISLLLMGFLLGIRHALEADHVAAVASLATGKRSTKQLVKQGTIWGLGHSLTLFFIGSVVIWIDSIVPQIVARGLEFLVGGMLVLLGSEVIYRVLKKRVHFHFHEHAGKTHFHAHSHAHEGPHETSTHHHSHLPHSFPFRSFFVGLMHGMAGSAALILLTLETLQSPWLGMVYLLFFGVGSILGMALFSVMIAIPFHYSAKSLTWVHNGMQIAIGVFTLGWGISIMYQMGFAP